jgi:pentatricopeptide repeat protein
MNITTRAEFESNVTRSVLLNVVASCNQSLLNSSPCAICTTSLSNLRASYLTGAAIGNVSDCTAYPSIYAAAFANRFGPTDRGTARCLFSLDFAPRDSSRKKNNTTTVNAALIDLYAKCGEIECARKVFDKMPERDLVCWTSMISGYAHNGYNSKTLEFFDFMRGSGVKANRVGF